MRVPVCIICIIGAGPAGLVLSELNLAVADAVLAENDVGLDAMPRFAREPLHA